MQGHSDKIAEMKSWLQHTGSPRSVPRGRAIQRYDIHDDRKGHIPRILLVLRLYDRDGV